MRLDQRMLAMARGRLPAEKVFKNATIVNVFTGELIRGDIAVAEGFIMGIGSYSGLEEVDIGGRVVCPGFIDAHVHLESTLLLPARTVSAALNCGTTTMIVDPHEAANVAGPAGIDFMLAHTEGLPANIYFMLPSCVPAVAGEENGFTFTAAEMNDYIGHPRVIGLGEVMDYEAVLDGASPMHEKLRLFSGYPIDGHAPGLGGAELAAYALSGIGSDHESSDYSQALAKRRLGMQVLVREGTAARNLEAIVGGLVRDGLAADGFSFCTDDKDIADIEREGHIDHNVRMAIGLGLPAVDAIRMATINTARFYGLRHLGAIAPGYQADFLVLDSLEHVVVRQVYHRGVSVRGGEVPVTAPLPPELLNTVRVADDFAGCFSRWTPEGETPVIALQGNEIVTRRDVLHLEEPLDPQSSLPGYNRVAVLERHGRSGNCGLGLVSGFGLRDGAIASSVGHDSHNVIVIGDNSADMVLAVSEVVRMQGGFALVANGAVAGNLPLPIMGLLSTESHEVVETRLSAMKSKARQMGVPADIDPFTTLSFIALPVIPELRLTTRGMFDVVNGSYLI